MMNKILELSRKNTLIFVSFHLVFTILFFIFKNFFDIEYSIIKRKKIIMRKIFFQLFDAIKNKNFILNILQVLYC